jgi:hypothetical protein
MRHERSENKTRRDAYENSRKDSRTGRPAIRSFLDS